MVKELAFGASLTLPSMGCLVMSITPDPKAVNEKRWISSGRPGYPTVRRGGTSPAAHRGIKKPGAWVVMSVPGPATIVPANQAERG
jgi:hypothetical protein